jgi:membrane-bound ClpP family serine protease
MAIESLILGVGGFVFLLILAGAFLAVQEAKAGSLHGFDFFFLAGIAIAFGVANYLWFFAREQEAGALVAIWVAGGIALALYFRSVFTRTLQQSRKREGDYE